MAAAAAETGMNLELPGIDLFEELTNLVVSDLKAFMASAGYTIDLPAVNRVRFVSRV